MRKRVDSPGKANLDPPACDRICDYRERAQARDAVRGDGLRLNTRRKAGLENDLACQVRSPRIRYDHPVSDGLDAVRVDAVPLDQAAHCMTGQPERAQILEGFARFDEGGSAAGDDCDSFAHAASITQRRDFLVFLILDQYSSTFYSFLSYPSQTYLPSFGS